LPQVVRTLIALLNYHPTPVEELEDPEFARAGVRVFLKREDLNHPFVSGNKWWKLKYNLEEALRSGSSTLLTFGGAFSNHIYATAAAAHELGLRSIGVIRGEEKLPLNPVLHFAQTRGMQLYYVSRGLYRQKTSPEFIITLRNRFGDFYLIPEGGTNPEAVRGTQELGEMLMREYEFDYLCCAVGTGGTIAGLINGLKGQKQVIGFPVLKDATYLEEVINNYLIKPYTNWRLVHHYHHGGFARSNAALLAFRQHIFERYNLWLDRVYMAKVLWAVIHEIRSGNFERGSTILILHSGGSSASVD
jgi:1-aminocyclopropane-1-carboxylate deaminase